MQHSSKSSQSSILAHVSTDLKKRQVDNIQKQKEFQQKLEKMRKQSNADQSIVDQYEKTEILRKSVNDVQTRAALQKKIRTSPSKYKNVQSKVAGNLQSQKNSKNMNHGPNLDYDDSSEMPSDNFYSEYWSKTQIGPAPKSARVYADTQSSQNNKSYSPVRQQKQQSQNYINKSQTSFNSGSPIKNKRTQTGASINGPIDNSQYATNNNTQQYQPQQQSTQRPLQRNNTQPNNNFMNNNNKRNSNGTNGSKKMSNGNQRSYNEPSSGSFQQYQQNMSQSQMNGSRNGNMPNNDINDHMTFQQNQENPNNNYNGVMNQRSSGGSNLVNGNYHQNKLSTVQSEEQSSHQYQYVSAAQQPQFGNNPNDQRYYQQQQNNNDQDDVGPISHSQNGSNAANMMRRTGSVQEAAREITDDHLMRNNNYDFQSERLEYAHQDNSYRMGDASATASYHRNNQDLYYENDQSQYLSSAAAQEKRIEQQAAEDQAAEFQEHMQQHPELVEVYQEAAKSITKLDMTTFQQLKIVNKPSAKVLMALEPLAVFMDCKDTKWSTIQKLISDTHILQRMQDYDYENIPVKTLRSVEKWILLPDYNKETITKSSKHAGLVAEWVIATYEIGMIKNQMELKNRPELEQKRAELLLQERQRQEEEKQRANKPKKLPPPPVMIKKNMEIEQATAQVAQEFERVANVKRNVDPNIKGFYGVIDDFYAKDGNERHISPVKRLVAHKTGTFDHKQVFQANYYPEKDYKLEYTTSPTKSYVIEPKDGPIDYSLATKNPLKFYDNVLNSDVTQHKVTHNKEHVERLRNEFEQSKKNGTSPPKAQKVPLEMTSKQTKRKVGKVIHMVVTHLNEMLMERLGDENPEMVNKALKDTKVQRKIQQAVQGNQIMLVDDEDKPIHQVEMKLMGQQSAKTNLADMANANGGSADKNNHQPRASLVVDNDALDQVHHEVVDYIRRNSQITDDR